MVNSEMRDERAHGARQDAAQIAVAAAKGARAGGAAGAAAAGGKEAVVMAAKSKKGRRFLVGSLIAVLVLVLGFPLAMFAASTALVAQISTVRTAQDAQFADKVVQSGIPSDTARIMQDESGRAGIQWYVLAAIFHSQQNGMGGMEPGKGPYLIKEDAAKAVPAPGADDHRAASAFVADRVREAIDKAGINPQTDIGLGSALIDGKLVWLDEGQHNKVIVEPYTKALATLPLAGANETWAQQVITDAVKWRLGQDMASCSNMGAGGDPSAVVASGEWTQPTVDADGVTGRPFGMQMHPIQHVMKMHNGIDITNNEGTPIWSVHDGTVSSVSSSPGGGNIVKIDHGGNVTSVYMHLKTGSITVRGGQQVKAGQPIAQMGNTGASTAPHLHFEIRLSGTPTDPDKFMKERGVNVLSTKPPAAPTPGAVTAKAAPPTVDLPVGGIGGQAATPAPAQALSVASPTTAGAPSTSTNPTSLTTKKTNGQAVHLNQVQINNAALIIGIGKSLAPQGITDVDIQAALMGAMQESELKQLASRAVPESLKYPNEGVAAGDHDSIGLYQQRATQGTWGTVAQIMNKDYTVRTFYGGPTKPNKGTPPGMLDVKRTHPDLRLGRLVQKVQVSAFPTAYDQWEFLAADLMKAVDGTLVPSEGSASSCAPQGDMGGMPGMGTIVQDGQFKSSDRSVGSEARLRPKTVRLKRIIAGTFPEITVIGGYRASARDPKGHPSGNALDIMVNKKWNTPEGKAVGDKVASFLMANQQALNVDYFIWRQQNWRPGRGWKPMADRGSPTQNHYDHVHVNTTP